MNNVFELTWVFMKARKQRDYYKHQKIAMPPGMKLMDHKGKSFGTLGKKHIGKDSLSLSQYINSLAYRKHNSQDADKRKKLTSAMMLDAVSPENPYNLKFLADHSRLGKTMAMNPLAINNDGHHVSGPNGDHEHHDKFTDMYPEHHFNEDGQAAQMKINDEQPKAAPAPAPELPSMNHADMVREAMDAVGPDHEKIMEYINNMSAQPEPQPEPQQVGVTSEPRPEPQQVGVTGQTSLRDFGF